MPRDATEGLGIDTGWQRLGCFAGHGRKQAAWVCYRAKQDSEVMMFYVFRSGVFRRQSAGECIITAYVCQEPASTGKAEQRTHGPGPGQHTRPDPEAEARRRDEQRKHKAAADEATRKASESQQQTAPQSSLAIAQRQQEDLKWNKIRWQVATGETALFIALCIFGNFGYGVKMWWHDFTYKWDRDHPSQQLLVAENFGNCRESAGFR